jgi:hypothetical protein
MVVEAYQIGANIRDDVHEVVVAVCANAWRTTRSASTQLDGSCAPRTAEFATIIYLTSITTGSMFNIRQNRRRRDPHYKSPYRILRRLQDEG